MSNPLEDPKFEQAVRDSDGQMFHGNLVVMTVEMFQKAVGLATEEDFDESVKQLNERLTQVDKGETESHERFWSEFRQRNGISN